MSDHLKGLVLTALGVLIVSPDTLLIRLAGMDVWTLAVYRGYLQSLGLCVILLCYYRGSVVQAFKAVGLTGLFVAALFCFNTLTFIAAVEYTRIANVLVILATAPFFAALLSLIFLKEPVPPRTWAAIVAALLGVALIMAESLGRGALIGDLLALATAFALGLKITIFRANSAINMIPAMAFSGIILGTLSLPFAAPLAVESEQIFWAAVMGLCVVAPATALVTTGPRYIPAPEASLIIVLETVLGPLWVWLVIKEQPAPLALVGGAVVVATLVLHSLMALRRPAPLGQTP